ARHLVARRAHPPHRTRARRHESPEHPTRATMARSVPDLPPTRRSRERTDVMTAEPPQPKPSAAIRGPLDGLVVADLSRVLAGPYASMLLADLGATVIKVESAAGDDTRTWMPPEKHGVATYYLSINRNKQSVVLDFTDAA